MTTRLPIAAAFLLLVSCGSGVRETAWSGPSGDEIVEVTGSQGHCGWESVSFLYFDDRRYVADPHGVVDAEGLRDSYQKDADLPRTAKFTEYRNGDRELWTAPNVAAVFVVAPDHVEKWPEITAGCA